MVRKFCIPRRKKNKVGDKGEHRNVKAIKTKKEKGGNNNRKIKFKILTIIKIIIKWTPT